MTSGAARKYDPASNLGKGPECGLFLQGAGKLWLQVFGWETGGFFPDVKRAIIVAAPHTSNWDMPFSLAVCWSQGLRVSWIGKDSLFKPPFGGFMRWLGGIQVVRGQRSNQVERIANALREKDGVFAMIAPSGTRSKAEHWKSGFYHIALQAEIPILLGYLDYGKKRGGVGELFIPSGNIHEDMDRIRAFYAGMTGKRPENDTPIRLKEEAASAKAVEIG